MTKPKNESLQFAREQKTMKTKTEIFHEELESIPDDALHEYCRKELSKLCKTGARSFTMTVPPRLLDTDILFSELLRRFKRQTQ